ncbi:MAG: amidohydrolase family protein, partial [Gemmatimonadales bacterium]
MTQRLTNPKPTRIWIAMLFVVTSSFCSSPSQNLAVEDLATYVDTLSAIDSHAHPMAYVAPGAPADTDFDALPLDGIPPFDLPLPLHANNPAYKQAQASFYQTKAGDTDSVRAAARSQAIAHHGEQFQTWVLDQLHISTMLANRVAMGTGLKSPRFRWVSFADALMYPLDISGEGKRTPDTKALYPLEAKLLRRYLRDLGLAKVPPTLDGYLREVVTATLLRQHDAGAVSIKFEAAYLRPLDFNPADSSAAATIYRRFAAAGVPTSAEYKTLEDYLIRYINREAGRLGMAVQIHSTNEFGKYYSADGAAPHLLDSMFSDASLKGTNFVIVHGGWPLIDETIVQLKKPNVYADISMMDQLADSTALARSLRLLLESAPDKVMFGTDAFDGGALQGWEQVGWVAAHNARRALADALTSMVHDKTISPERARELA